MTALAALVLAVTQPLLAASPAPLVVQSPRGAWSARAQLGWPWSGLEGELGLTDALALQVDLGTALFRRWDAQAGLSLSLLRAERFHLSAALHGGAVVQPATGTGVRQLAGPQVELGLRAVVPWRVAPWLELSSQHLVQVERTVTSTTSGELSSASLEHLWSPAGSFGVSVPTGEHAGVELGLDVMRVDGAFAIPGAQLAVRVGGGR